MAHSPGRFQVKRDPGPHAALFLPEVRGIVNEIEDQPVDGFGPLLVGDVTRLGDDHRRRPGDIRAEIRGMGGRQDLIFFTPDNKCRRPYRLDISGRAIVG